MAGKLSQEPLISREEDEFSDGKKKKNKLVLVSFLKCTIKVVMWAIFVMWVSYIFLYATESGKNLYRKSITGAAGTPFGLTGVTFMMFSAPVILIAILATVYVALRDENDVQEEKAFKVPQFRLGTFPVLVDGPFGVVSAAEMIGIILFVVYIIWSFSAETLNNIRIVSVFHHLPSKEHSLLMLELTGLRLGLIGMFCLSFLFLPVSRGSALLRLIDIPFEQATRYHVWLGHLTMALFTLHALFYLVAWTFEGRLLEFVMEWRDEGVAIAPGVVSLVAGLFMWGTSLPGVRTKKFELFFYTHQLYVLFIVFLALHVGDLLFCFAAGGVFLFVLDRFLRFCQSRRKVSVLSARSFGCGTVELELSKPANSDLRYNALGWIFLQVREISLLQWHPFSVSSTPLDGKDHLVILIKVLGDWTRKLESRISRMVSMDSGITACVEGPYGHESPYYLMYENLVLVAGGIGISPFVAMLNDILRRISDEKPCFPKNVVVIWAVKKSDEVQLLETTLNTESISSSFSHSLNLEIQTYVTRESEPEPRLEEGNVTEPVKFVVFPASVRREISVLVGTGDVIWLGMYTVASTIGLVITLGVLNALYMSFHVTQWWFKGLLFVACMITSVVVFGGVVIGFWHLWGTKTPRVESGDKVDENVHIQRNEKAEAGLKNINTVLYGKRPNFTEIFEAVSKRWGDVNVGVIVSGPSTLRSSVAAECRSRNLCSRSNQTVFHFNSHSFDL